MRLGFYTPRFPYRQGPSAGPYPAFLSRPRTPLVVVQPKGTCSHGCKACPHARQCSAITSIMPRVQRRRHMHGLGDGTAGLPAGSTLVYYATWQLSELSHLTTFTSPSGVAAQIAPLAAAQGINITVGTAVGFLASVSSFTLNITTTADRNADTDVKAVLDNLIYQSVGVMPTSSIVLTSVLATANAPAAVTPTNPTAAAADLAAYNAAIANGDSVGAAAALAQYKIDTGTALLPSNPLAWVESNALYICGGILAFILLREFA